MPDVKGIVIHYTGTPKQTAAQCRNYFENLKKQAGKKGGTDIFASAHFIVGIDGEIIQAIPVSEMAYHVGAYTYNPDVVARLSRYPNDCTVGIEMCCTDGKGNFTEETEKAAAELAARLCNMFSLKPETDLYRHHDVTGKLCPKLYVEKPERWHTFRCMVTEMLDGLKKAKAVPGLEEDIWI